MGDTTINVDGDNLGEIAGRDLHKTTIYTGDQAFDVRGLVNPYLGLRAFTYAERARYAGREDEIAHAVATVSQAGAERTLLFVTGASGSGKSSFAQAGLLPGLEAHYHARGLAVKWVVFRPGALPLAEVARAMEALGQPLDGLFAPAAEYALSPPAGPLDPNQISVLVIDQFEEFFSQADAAQRRTVFAMLAHLPAFKERRLHVIATLRADYLPDLFPVKPLYETAKAGIDLRAMGAEALKSAIQRPLQVVHPQAGKRFQSALLDRLAHDTAHDATFLPLLQVTLEDLWRRGFLTVDGYRSLTHAIQRRADEIYAYNQGPDGSQEPRRPAEQARMMALFLGLVAVSFDDDGRRDVRRTRRLADLSDGNAEIDALVQELVAARLLSTDHQELEGAGGAVETVDIIHESLIHNWERLRCAIRTQRERLQRRHRFELRLGDWQEQNQADSYLLAGVQLEEAIELQATDDIATRSPDARHFIDQSKRIRDRARSFRLRMAVAVAGVLLLLLGGMVYAWQEQAEARREEAAQRSVAEQRALVLAAQNLMDAELRLRLPLQALRMAEQQRQRPLLETFRALLGGLAVAPVHAARISTNAAENVGDLTLDPEGRWLALQRGSNSGTARLYDLQSGQVIALPADLGAVNRIHFVPGSRYLVVDALPKIHVLRRSDFELHCTMNGDDGELYLVDLNVEGGQVLTLDGTVLRLWSLDCDEVGRISLEREMDAWRLNSATGGGGRDWIRFNANHTLVIARLDDLFYRWDITRPQAPVALPVLPGAFVAGDPAGARLLLSDGATVHLLDTISGAVSPTGLDGRVGRLHPDGEHLWTLDRQEGTVSMWAVETGELALTIRPEQSLGARSRSEILPSEPPRLLIVGEQRVELFDATTGASLPSPPVYGGAAEVTHVDMDPSGSWLVIQVRNGLGQDVLELWSLALNRKVVEYGYRSGFFAPFDFSGDGRFMAVLGVDPALRTSTLRIWELPLLDTVDLYAGPTRVYALQKQGQTGRQLVDVAAGEPVGHVQLAPDSIGLLHPSQSGGWLVDTTCHRDLTDCTLNLWDLRRESPVLHRALECTGTGVDCPADNRYTELAVSPDGRWLAAADYELPQSEVDDISLLPVAIWDLETERRMPDLPHDNRVRVFAWNPVDSRLATLDESGVVRLWDLGSDVPAPKVLPPDRQFIGLQTQTSLAFTPDGERLFFNLSSWSSVGALVVVDVESMTVVNRYDPDNTGSRPGVVAAHPAPDGDSLFVVLAEETAPEMASVPGQQIQHWTLDGLSLIGQPMLLDGNEVTALAFSQHAAGEGLLLAAGSNDGLVRVWDAASGELRMEIPHADQVDRVSFAPDGQGLFTVDAGGRLYVWALDFTAAHQFYGLDELACSRLSRPFSDSEWAQYMGDRPRGEPRLCPHFD